jgi:hypothetical protein
MEIVLKISPDNYQNVRQTLLKDDVVSRASIIFKDGKYFGENWYYCIISGTEEQLDRVSEMIKSKDVLAEVVEGAEARKILQQLKEEEEKAIKGFGDIFG